jgi:predicted amidohydrolase YtcJ
VLDLLLKGGLLHQSNGSLPVSAAIGLSGGKIAFVGDLAQAPAALEIVELSGQLITPGFMDSHNHLLLGFDPDAVNLQDLVDLESVRSRMKEFAESRPDLEWICGENANYSVVEGRRPNSNDLAGITNRPIFITTYDQHSVWLNDVAIRALGIEPGVELSWGRPEFDEVTNKPTGWVTDFYTSAMTTLGLKALQRDIPMYSPDRRYRKLLASMEMATRFGITTVVEPQVPMAELDLFNRALSEGKLTSRVIAALFHPVDEGPDFRMELRNTIESHFESPTLSLGPIKLYADDVIEPHTAWLLDDYANKPGHRGNPSTSVAEFHHIVAELDRMGLQTHTHATGDGGIRLVLDAIENATKLNGTTDRRHGIVHVECIHPDDLSRLAQLGITAAMQPRHCSPDLIEGSWMNNIGENRWDRAWRIKSLQAVGTHVALSSDWQVGEMDPLVGIYSAMTRASLDGKRSWTQDERISLSAAIDGYTKEGAWAWHRESEFGALGIGMAADLVVWSSNLNEYSFDPTGLLGQSTLLTIVDGQIVYDAR